MESISSPQSPVVPPTETTLITPAVTAEAVGALPAPVTPSSEYRRIATSLTARRPLSWKLRSACRYVLPYPAKMVNYAGLRAAIAAGNYARCYPVKLGVEVSSRCNLRCPLCPRSSPDARRPTGDMRLSDFTRLIDHLAPYLFHVRLHGLGEPMLNPSLPEMIRYAHGKGIYTNFHTNGHFLTRPNIDNLLQSGLDELTVALDGMSGESYSAYRIGGEFSQVRSGIERLCDARKERKLRTPRVNVQFLVMSSNEHEIPSLLSFASSIGVDRVHLKSVNIAWGKHRGDRTYLPAGSAYSRYRATPDQLALARPQRCSRVFTETIVNWDGTVSACTGDHPGTGTIPGNVFRDDIDTVLFSKEYVEARRRSLSMNFEWCRLCTDARSPV
jgi:MoaA/NifB/PqqE/SkfB family radical SAM enzyme